MKTTLLSTRSRKSHKLTRWAVDPSPLAGLWLAARQDLRDRHTRHTEAVQKVQLPHLAGRYHEVARLAECGQLCTWGRCCPGLMGAAFAQGRCTIELELVTVRGRVVGRVGTR